MTATTQLRRRPETGSWYRRWGKRTLDLFISVPLAVLVAPFSIVIALFIRREDGGPAVFRQERVGASGRRFTLLKFRTMPTDTEHLPSALAGNLRVTRVGRVLRRTSLDEIPQLVSVLRGDMTLVGPRPALPVQTELLALREKYGALDARPGLTGLAQVNSYDGMPEDEKARWDGQYSNNISMRNDVSLLMRTFGYLTHKPPQY